MKLKFTNVFILLMMQMISQAVFAQTYTITTNTNFSALSPSAAWCTGCTFNISPGKTLTFNSSTGLVNPVFNGGILIESSSMAFQGGTFNVDSMSVTNTGTSFQVSTTQAPTFKNGSLYLNVGITIQGATFNNENIYANIPTGKTLTLQASGSFLTTTFTNSNFIAHQGSILMNSAATMTGSTMTLDSVAMNSNTGQFLLSGSQMYLNGTSSFSQSSTPLALKNNSEIVVGDGTLASTAYMFLNMGANGVQISDNSLIKVANEKNSYQNNAAYQYTSSAGATTSYSTMSNTISCGAGHTNTCKANYVYGCATLNFSGATGCIILATNISDLSAHVNGANTVTLSWETTGSTNAAQYQLQRSTNGYDWSNIDAVTAEGYSSSEYHYTDASAPAGTDYYRLVQTDKNGSETYSSIVTVNVAAASGGISIFPNPVTGHTFSLKTATTAPLMLNAYSISGQLLFRTSLKGQLLYSVQLPSSVNTGEYIVLRVITSEGSSVFTVLNK